MHRAKLTKLPTLPSWVTRTRMRSAKACRRTSVCTPSISLPMFAVCSIVNVPKYWRPRGVKANGGLQLAKAHARAAPPLDAQHRVARLGATAHLQCLPTLSLVSPECLPTARYLTASRNTSGACHCNIVSAQIPNNITSRLWRGPRLRLDAYRRT